MYFHAFLNNLDTLSIIGLSSAAHGGVGGLKHTPFPNIWNTYPTGIKISAVIPYLKKIQKKYKLRDKPPKLC